MSKDDSNYTQCVLYRAFLTSTQIDVVWIPTKFAEIGKKLVIKEDTGWTVAEIGVTRPWSDSSNFERDYLHQREASDI